MQKPKIRKKASIGASMLLLLTSQNLQLEPILTRLLNLPGIVVENFHESETDLLLEIEA